MHEVTNPFRHEPQVSDVPLPVLSGWAGNFVRTLWPVQDGDTIAIALIEVRPAPGIPMFACLRLTNDGNLIADLHRSSPRHYYLRFSKAAGVVSNLIIEAARDTGILKEFLRRRKERAAEPGLVP